MKNLHLIRTDKRSRLRLDDGELVLGNSKLCQNTLNYQYQHIYITSDEEINNSIKPCWCVNTVKNTWNDDLIYYQGSMPLYHYKGFKKIILTTDQNLIKDGVQAIDDEFLEWFVKNPTCEFVKIEPDYDEIRGDYYRIILKEEQPKEIIYYCKQETLEEAAIRLFNDFQKNNPIVPKNNINPYKLGFIDGIKWQQERMYSEEDMIEFAEFVATYPDKNKNINGQILHAKSKYDGSERTVDLLEQFKKK
jgi:hypothetical protein